MDNMPREFISEILKLGVISYSEQETTWQIAKKCAKIGVSMGAGTAILGMKAGSYTLWTGPTGAGITISGAMIGFLAGFVTGTAVCTAANTRFRPELQKLIREVKGKTIQ